MTPQKRTSASLATRPSLGLVERGFSILVVASGTLIVLGTLVRAHGAGLACPDWPLCFNRFIPRFDLKVAFEWTHRLVAGSVGFAFLVLAGRVWLRPETRRIAGGVTLCAALLLALQVLLGALTVWKQLAAWTVTAHLLTGNAFTSTLWITTLALRERQKVVSRIPLTHSGARFAVIGVTCLLVLQLLLGGLVSSRYAGLACPEWPTCSDGAWFPNWAGAVGLQLVHRGNGYALLLASAATALLCRHEPRLARLTATGAALVLAQIAVGVANVLLRLPVEITVLHSAIAALLVLLWTTALREAWLAPRTKTSN